jgi:hypothetical protein
MVLTMTLHRMHTLAAVHPCHLRLLMRRLMRQRRGRGRPWSCPLRRRILIACAALRTNLTVRELAAVFDHSKSTAHRIVADMTTRLAAFDSEPALDRRSSWVVDGTLVRAWIVEAR